MSAASYSLDQYVADLRQIAAETGDEDEILRRVGALAQRFVADRSWLQPKHYEADTEQGFGVHLLHEEPDHSLAILVLSWLPGRGTPPHDHGTWAVVAGVDGVERNVRYNRIDDGSRDDVTLSVHTYGRHVNFTNRSQFDLDSKQRKAFIVRVE
jgi:predicted metal-dependent enzyme (double-stranded beta helix superfamily)